jgi:hypothetical protein
MVGNDVRQMMTECNCCVEASEQVLRSADVFRFEFVLRYVVGSMAKRPSYICLVKPALTFGLQLL